MALFTKPFELRADGQLIAKFRTYEKALSAARTLTGRDRWAVDKRIGNRRFNQAFGYTSGTTSTMDLAAMGVPIGPRSLSDRKL
jgi:hypothetical protein